MGFKPDMRISPAGLSRRFLPVPSLFLWIIFWIVLWIIVASGPLSADIVHLKNGGKIEGQVIKQTPTEIHIRTKFGSIMKFPRSQVIRIEKKMNVWDEYEILRNKTKNTDAAGLFNLYHWCMKHGLKREAVRVLEEVLQADPDHEGAHRLKGEVKIQGKWLNPDAARAAGFHLHEGKWLTHDKLMKARGFVRWGSKWITKSEYNRMEVKLTMEKLLNMELTVVNSEHFGVRTRFPKHHAERLLEYSESAYKAFMEIIPYPKKSLKNWSRIQIWLFDNLDSYQLFFDKFLWPKKNVTKQEDYNYYREAGNCNFHYPHPIIVLRRSSALPKFSDQAALTIHNIGHVMLHRMKKSIYPPDWLEEGLGHLMEEKIFGVSRIFCQMPGKLTRKEIFIPGWRNSGKWKQKMSLLLIPNAVPPWKTLMKKPLGGMNSKELAKVYGVLRMIIKKKPKALRAFLDKATKHSWVQVFQDATGWSPDDVDKELAQFIRTHY